MKGIHQKVQGQRNRYYWLQFYFILLSFIDSRHKTESWSVDLYRCLVKMSFPADGPSVTASGTRELGEESLPRDWKISNVKKEPVKRSHYKKDKRKIGTTK